MNINKSVYNKLAADYNVLLGKAVTELDRLGVIHGYTLDMEIALVDEDSPYLLSDELVKAILNKTTSIFRVDENDNWTKEEVEADLTSLGFYPGSICGHYLLYDRADFKLVDDQDWFQNVLCENEYGCLGCNVIALTKELVEIEYSNYVVKFTKKMLGFIDPKKGVTNA